MTTTRKNLDLIGVFFGLRFHVVQFGLHVDNCCIPLLHLRVKSNEIKKNRSNACNVGPFRFRREFHMNETKRQIKTMKF